MSKLNLTLIEVAELLDGAQIVGNGDFVCRNVAPLEAATPQDLSFVRDAKAQKLVATSLAGALVVSEVLPGSAAHQLVVSDTMSAMVRVLDHIGREKRLHAARVHPRAVVDEGVELGSEVTVGAGAVVCQGAKIGDRAVIYANAYIGHRSEIGNDSIIYPNVSVMEDVRIGERVIIHSGSVVGCDGYGFVTHEGRHLKVPQVGEVVIGDDVEIGACTTIDRGTVAATRIGSGTKIGDLVHVAHNVQIGEDVLLLPTVAISGSTTVGDRAVFAGRAGCSGHLKIGEGAILGATTVAFKDVEPGAVLWGNPAREKVAEMRIQALLTRLPEMAKEIRRLRRETTDAQSERKGKA